MRKILKRLALGRRISTFAGFIPVTPLGTAVLALSAVGFWFLGDRHRDILLLVAPLCCAAIGVTLILITAISAFFVHRGARRAGMRAGLGLETSQPSLTGFAIGFPQWIPLVSCEWTWAAAPRTPRHVDVTVERTRGMLEELVTPLRRGILPDVVRHFRVGDPFGLTRIRWTRKEKQSVTILAARAHLTQPVPLEGLSTGDDLADPFGKPVGDRVEMRPYAPGDPPRLILWKIYGRTGKLMVRVPERAVAICSRGCAYMVTGPGDESGAAIARAVLETNALGETWAFGADGSTEFATQCDDAMILLARSGNSSYRGEWSPDGLSNFLGLMDSQGYSHCVLFTPPSAGPWIEQLRMAIASTSLRTQVIVGVTEMPSEGPRRRWERFVFQSRPEDTKAAAELSRVIEEVGASVSNLCVIDRSTGSVHSGNANYMAVHS